MTSLTTLALNTTFVEPLHFLEKHFLAQRDVIEEWFQREWQLTPAPVYGSVDLRNAGFKLAPIDMNLFPAGFNNLNPEFLSISVGAAKTILHKINPQAKKILIIPEEHTRNLFYWSNILTLVKILQQGGFEVRLGNLNGTSQTIKLESDETLTIDHITRKDNILHVDHFLPELILLNNDLSEGIPDLLQNLNQPIIPPAELGWSLRLKSDHFQYYEKVAHEFAALMQIDPWWIAPLFRHCGEIDFMQQDGLACLEKNAIYLFDAIQKKYDEYKLPYQPFLIVKADAGTYGMAVMTLRNVEELKTLNRKQRTRMSKTKGGQPVRRVIIQEGVYSFETLGEKSVAEPVVYLWGQQVVGGFYRVHHERGIDENLNSPGMRFEPLAFSTPCQARPDIDPDACQNRFYIYGIIAQLSMLAAAREIKTIVGT